ncbi:putative membrane channel-forming protein YqfA (hemolysin III family) [Cryobacterium sp. CAN_C3]|uniref:hypothetical protein n=1 Tax=unclassified Cryobacterium TaxID=2649013 RepID=UPI0018CB8614|nr:hypothetical protein [Cryobacterium sp. CAN_C3]MEC5155433.1 putative membrane channel-forming protein YqfA (hemolysin III family) [Cryobacterium sp. CAN_C3]
MRWIRKLTPLYRMMLGALFLGLVALVTDTVFDWAPNWLILAFYAILFTSNVYTFRMLWKQTDHPAFHGDKMSLTKVSSAPSNTEHPGAEEEAHRRLG